jgi:hypothetical protein
MSLVFQSFLPYPNSCLGTSPHQQGRDTKMAQRSFCGIDVAKDRLDVMVLPEGWGGAREQGLPEFRGQALWLS